MKTNTKKKILLGFLLVFFGQFMLESSLDPFSHQTPENDPLHIIDFDAQRSIVCKGNGTYNLKPVIRVFTEVLTGSVHGIVSPPEADSIIHLIRQYDTLSAKSDTVGNFMFRGLEPDTYNIDVLTSGNLSDTTLAEIEVFAGLTTEIDTVYIQ